MTHRYCTVCRYPDLLKPYIITHAKIFSIKQYKTYHDLTNVIVCQNTPF